MKRRVFETLLFTVIFAVSVECSGSRDGWEDLFNGKNLKGWVQRGGNAEYKAEDRVITGISNPQSSSFLCTEKEYGDFILELELKADHTVNSGIQIRSHSLPEYKNGIVFGYQVEIDPSPRGWSGGIYDEARAGWLYPVTPNNPEAVTAFKNNEWNHYRIEAIGNNIKTWVNGIPVADLLVDLDASGFIALQIHGIKPGSEAAGKTVQWRNIRIMTVRPETRRKTDTPPVRQVNAIPNTLTEQEKSEGWILLFDGATANGWRKAGQETFPETGWIVNNGILEVMPGNEKGAGGDIITVEQFDNFDLVFDFQLTEGANSGLKYYVTENLYAPGTLGLEYQLLDDVKHPDAKMGKDGNRTLSSLYDLIPAGSKRFNGINQWNTGRVLADHNHVEHWLNGFKVLEYERGGEAYRKAVAESKFARMKDFGEAPKGHILLQDHHDRAYFRNIKIKKLN
ncbi:MAG: DUF1080 domain-containing protein [Bacteroidales bacterium]|jgi:hypothetical protein|nr:DUF1080 domain-containing protein [Bacteroidales bacterium]